MWTPLFQRRKIFSKSDAYLLILSLTENNLLIHEEVVKSKKIAKGKCTVLLHEIKSQSAMENQKSIDQSLLEN